MIYDGEFHARLGYSYKTRGSVCDYVVLTKQSDTVKNWLYGLVIGGDQHGMDMLWREDGKFGSSIEDHPWDLVREIGRQGDYTPGCKHGTYVNCGFTSAHLVCRDCGKDMAVCEGERLFEELFEEESI